MLRTEGIVLNEIRFKETSKILNIYTKKNLAELMSWLGEHIDQNLSLLLIHNLFLIMNISFIKVGTFIILMKER